MNISNINKKFMHSEKIKYHNALSCEGVKAMKSNMTRTVNNA